jgi:hypothetical protein
MCKLIRKLRTTNITFNYFIADIETNINILYMSVLNSSIRFALASVEFYKKFQCLCNFCTNIFCNSILMNNESIHHGKQCFYYSYDLHLFHTKPYLYVLEVLSNLKMSIKLYFEVGTEFQIMLSKLLEIQLSHFILIP